MECYNTVPFLDLLKFFILIFFFFFFGLFRAIPMAYESSQARGQVRAVAAGLRHSHSNMGSKPHLQPTPQLTAVPDPEPTKRGQGLMLDTSRVP